jgi:signal transduction histidine kinase
MQKMKAVEQLVGGIAHNFNNKLAIVTGYLELLEEHLKNNDEASAWVKECMTATEFCVELTKELLSFTSFQRSKPEVLNINNVINSINQHITQIITPEIEVTYNLSEKTLLIFTSYIELTTALLIIITNACEAMPDGGKLSITTEKKYLDENYIHSHPGIAVGFYIQITISDTGRGMDKELQKRIFDPFFTTKKVGEGTGLNLPIVYGYIKHNKGLIDVSSEPGKGTIFSLYLPEADENSLEKDSA